ncbi:MAG: magnesium-translocating P-type ATPase [Patescibacteria group bacterium]|nr:magnesium-translocating P-type ATPase [Patescibacteria group bacterium]
MAKHAKRHEHGGIVERDVVSIPSKQSQEIVEKLKKFGSMSADDVLRDLQTSLNGLTHQEALQRLRQYGANEVAREKPPPWHIQFFQAFVNPFIGILFILAGTSFFIDVFLAYPADRDMTKVVILLAMIVISGSLRFFQEFRSQKAAEKLRAMVQNKTRVTRQHWKGRHHETSSPTDTDNAREIPINDIVPGDIITLASGDIIPADIRLLSSKDLYVSQSALTGESMPVEKYAAIHEVSENENEEHYKKTGNNPLEFGTLCFMGTNVVSGTAVGVVVATGNRTYFGSMAKGIVGQRAMTSFDKGVNKVSWVLILFMLVMVPIVFLLNGMTKGDWGQALFFALAIAVGLTPEMLPVVVTANLAKGSIRMAKKKVIVKKLNAIQNFGAMDVLCTDKTGTITENRIVLVRHLDALGKENNRVLTLAFLNSYFQTGLKNLMDEAVIQKQNDVEKFDDIHSYKKIDEIPFDFTRRRMSVIVQKDGKDMLICKGAVEEILRICSRVEEHGEIVPIQELTHRKSVRELTKQLNEEGLRVIAVAYKPVSDTKRFYSITDEHDLILAGYIGFLDPPKESAKESLRRLEHHGIAVKIITGDNEIVAQRICHDVGLPIHGVLLGSEIDALTDKELARKAETTTIFAKVDPLQKARIVSALKLNGHTVGFMGDGINDAAAMREADVGISVDTGVDIAKEAADIILLKNDLSVLDDGVVEGRTIFGNIMKYIKMTASSNFGNVFSVLVASAFLPFLPMLPIHLLIQNLLYDVSQISIPWDNMDKEFLRFPRKWQAGNMARFMVCIGPVSSIFDITTFAVMWFVFRANTPAEQSLFQSGWFVEGLLSQTLVIHMLRTERIPFLQSTAAKPVLLLTAAIMAIGILFPFSPFGRHVGFQPLPLSYFPWLIGILLSYCVLSQGVKMLYIRTFRSWL